MMQSANPYPPRPRRRHPRLVFSPLAWLKLQFFCHAGVTEVGGFGIAAANDLLYIEDFVTVRQQVSPMTVRFMDDAVADFFDRCVDAGLTLQRFSRLWVHTHPGESVTPSATDEETFARVFGGCDWALMFILGRTGNTYARLAFNTSPYGHFLIPTAVDWEALPNLLASEKVAVQIAQWQKEYADNVQLSPSAAMAPRAGVSGNPHFPDLGRQDSDPFGHEFADLWLEPLEDYHPNDFTDPPF